MGDWLSAGLDLFGVIPFVGEVADTAKIARIADNTIDATKSGKRISNPILKSFKVGKATKIDAHHAFPNIIDNYAGTPNSR